MESLNIRKILVRCPETLKWRHFQNPVEVLVTRQIDQVRDLIYTVEKFVNDRNLYAVGFVSYEASSAFNSRMITCEASRFPLVCFALFENYEILEGFGESLSIEKSNWKISLSLESYIQNIVEIRDRIESGDIYQINYTTKFRAMLNGPEEFFKNFVSDEPYACFIDTDEFQILSASPELFFELDGEDIKTKPMKGTAPRYDSLKLDEDSRNQLSRSTKNRAENLMITDMMRNDLSKIAMQGSVSVENAFRIEGYSTVWQMTSTVKAKTCASVLEIFNALFPCSSITGAPKLKSMEYIKRFEKEPRDIYTGAIGIIQPNRKAVFSVGIRTALRNIFSSETVYGSGGGIVWDSKPIPEFKELCYKTRILGKVENDEVFYLFETMRFRHPVGILMLARHLERMGKGADYFGIKYSEKIALAFIKTELKSQKINFDAKLKLTLNSFGKLSLQCFRINKPFESNQLVQFVSTPVNRNDIFLYYKTNFRGVYDKAQSEVSPLVEPILFNQESEVTETNISNIVFEENGNLFTPPVECGLLSGIMRTELLQNNALRERVITKNELLKVDKVYLINALRGWRNARFLKRSVTE